MQRRGPFHMLNKSFKAQPLDELLQRTVGQCECFVELRAECSAVVVVMKSERAPFLFFLFFFLSVHTKHKPSTTPLHRQLNSHNIRKLYCSDVTLPQNTAEKLKTTFKRL